MPPMKFLCLHGLGSSANIFESQMGPLITQLSNDNSATFTFIDGLIPQSAGPGIAGLYEPPYYGYFRTDILQEATDLPSLATALKDPEYTASVGEAYAYIQEILAEEGPFTGILGFSHGATLAAMFLLDYAVKNPLSEPWEPVACAVFIGAPSPFGEDGIRLSGKSANFKLRLPTVHVVGKEDELYDDAMKVYDICQDRKVLVEHARGHFVPRDGETVGKIARAIRNMGAKTVAI